MKVTNSLIVGDIEKVTNLMEQDGEIYNTVIILPSSTDGLCMIDRYRAIAMDWYRQNSKN